MFRWRSNYFFAGSPASLQLGRKGLSGERTEAGLPYHQRAIELDPNFAMAYLAIAVDYQPLGELGRASEYFRKAFELREHASEREKLQITADYYHHVTGELDKAAQAYQVMVDNYPRSPGGYLGLGNVYCRTGKLRKGGGDDTQGPADSLPISYRLM